MRLLAWAAFLLLGVSERALAESVTVPVDVGVGPAAYFISGPVFRDQPVHFGLKLSVLAIIDQETIRKNRNRIPERYRKLAAGITEARVSPSFLIPDALIISPKFRRTGIYGATWRPISLSVPLVERPFRLDLNAGPLLTYAFLHSDVFPTTHFLRPGLDLKAELELPVSQAFLVSLGWASGFYIPQALGSWTAVGPFDRALWHFGQAFLKLHFRFPYSLDF